MQGVRALGARDSNIRPGIGKIREGGAKHFLLF